MALLSCCRAEAETTGLRLWATIFAVEQKGRWCAVGIPQHDKTTSYCRGDEGRCIRHWLFHLVLESFLVPLL